MGRGGVWQAKKREGPRSVERGESLCGCGLSAVDPLLLGF